LAKLKGAKFEVGWDGREELGPPRTITAKVVVRESEISDAPSSLAHKKFCPIRRRKKFVSSRQATVLEEPNLRAQTCSPHVREVAIFFAEKE